MAQVESTKSSGRLTLYTGIGLALGVAIGAVLSLSISFLEMN